MDRLIAEARTLTSELRHIPNFFQDPQLYDVDASRR